MPKIIAPIPGQRFTGMMYRVETGYRNRNATAWDIVQYEQEEMGNDIGFPEELTPLARKTPASYPFVDAATTVFSFVAMYWMNKRIVESWVIWVSIDIVGIVLYWQKDVKLVSILYMVYLVLASSGLYAWIKRLIKQDQKLENS